MKIVINQEPKTIYDKGLVAVELKPQTRFIKCFWDANECIIGYNLSFPYVTLIATYQKYDQFMRLNQNGPYYSLFRSYVAFHNQPNKQNPTLCATHLPNTSRMEVCIGDFKHIRDVVSIDVFAKELVNRWWCNEFYSHRS